MKVVYITKLYLENFRCYDKFEIDFDKELTVIVAENGQGKTAILDAVAIAMGPYLSCFSDGKARNIHETDVRQTVETASKKPAGNFAYEKPVSGCYWRGRRC